MILYNQNGDEVYADKEQVETLLNAGWTKEPSDVVVEDSENSDEVTSDEVTSDDTEEVEVEDTPAEDGTPRKKLIRKKK